MLRMRRTLRVVWKGFSFVKQGEGVQIQALDVEGQSVHAQIRSPKIETVLFLCDGRQGQDAG